MATVGKEERRDSRTELLPEVPKAVVQPDFTLNHYEFDHVHSNFDMNGKLNTGKATSSLSATTAPNDGERVIITDAEGTSVKFVIDESSSDYTSGTVNVIGGEYVVTVGVSTFVGATPAAAKASFYLGAIASSINAVFNGTQINFWVKATGWSPGVTIVNLGQTITGPHGNTAIDSNLTNVTVGNSGTFANGENHSQPPFSKRFQLVRPIANSGLAMSRNGIKIQG